MKKRNLILIISLVIIILIGNFLLHDKLKENNSYVITETIDNKEKINDNEEVLKLQKTYNNSDIKGIVSIEGEDSFNFPIAQSSDNDFYLNHDYYKNDYKYGSIYADYRVNLDNSRKILLYGHNSSYIDTPFGNLENYYNYDYYNLHKYIYITTLKDVYKYEIFSIYVETSDFTYMNINFSSDENWYSHLLKLQNKSIYNIDVNLNKNDDILIMQTCSNNNNYKDYDKKYLLIISRKIDNNNNSN